MTIPDLKRIKIKSEQELIAWLSKNQSVRDDIMLVTFNKASGANYVSLDRVREALYTYGWTTGRRYILNDTLIGHVIRKERR